MLVLSRYSSSFVSTRTGAYSAEIGTDFIHLYRVFSHIIWHTSAMTTNDPNTGDDSTVPATTTERSSRRDWLKLLGSTTALMGIGLSAGEMPESKGNGKRGRPDKGEDEFGLDDRIEQVTTEREIARESLVTGLTEYGHNGNEAYLSTVELYDEEFAPFLFTKGMPLETDEDGVPYPEGLVAVDRKLENYWDPVREQDDIDESFETGGQRLFIGVPAVHTVTHSGMDPWRGQMPPAPNPTGVRNAGEMIDLYAMEQLRDVPFTAYPNEPGGDDGPRSRQVDETLAAVERDLENVRERTGDAWWYDTSRLFVEADTETLDWGPYLSQYLLQEVNMGALPISQQYLSYEAGVDYNDTQSDWLRTLEGRDSISAEINPNEPESDERSYISTGRDLATLVNADVPYQEYLIAGLHLLANGSLADGLPYNSREEGSIFGYTNAGPTGFVDILARGARQALIAAFYQKYYQHFRCRPETYSGRLHFQRTEDREFGISEVLTDSATLATRDGPDFLSTAYEEGSPVHPAYPSGHSVIAGTCGTILKFMFQEMDWEAEYYVPTPDGKGRETVSVPSGHRGIYQEIDKLMSNVGLGRLFAGVHYYSDHYQAVKLGEQVAVGLLLDVFGRAYTGDKEVTATFSPYLEYETEYDLSIETLETLREQAISR